MTNEVRDSYDAMAKLYAELFLDALDDDANARRWLAVFAELASRRSGPIADLGCGPGHITNHLGELGLHVVGYDISPGQLAEARHAFPDANFLLGDLTALDHADWSVGGIVSHYSLIHIDPSCLADVFVEWMRVLRPGAPVYVSFFGALSPDAHGAAFDHKVVTAYALCPTTIAAALDDAGFVAVDVGVLDPPEGGRPFTQATVIARKPTD